MATSEDNTPKKKFNSRLTSTNRSQEDDWISEEELYTEGSGDEDDMALRMKRREKEQNPMKEIGRRPPAVSSEQSVVDGRRSTTADLVGENSNCQQDIHDESYLWRPTQGNSKPKQAVSADENIATEGGDGDRGAEPSSASESHSGTPSLSEAYSNMHKLDALLRDSDRRLKEAQAETLRAQLSTRAQLQELRDRVGQQNVVLARNWDAFMQLCPAVPAAGLPREEASKRASGALGDQSYSVLPRISSGEQDSSEQDSEDESPNVSGSALAITDEEKLKLADLLRDLDDGLAGEPDYGTASQAYTLDAEARRCLAHIDSKLQELVPDSKDGGVASGVASGVAGVSRGSTRQQRLEDIERRLQALAETALGDVEPVAEEEVRRLLRSGEGDGALADRDLLDGVLDDLLQEARKELPHFRYRHREDPASSGVSVDGESPESPEPALSR